MKVSICTSTPFKLSMFKQASEVPWIHLWFLVVLSLYTSYLSHLVTKPTKRVCAQRSLRSAWASAQSDQSLRCALNGWLRTPAFFMGTADAQADLSLCWAHNHIVGFVMRRLICLFALSRVLDYTEVT